MYKETNISASYIFKCFGEKDNWGCSVGDANDLYDRINFNNKTCFSKKAHIVHAPTIKEAYYNCIQFIIDKKIINWNSTINFDKDALINAISYIFYYGLISMSNDEQDDYFKMIAKCLDSEVNAKYPSIEIDFVDAWERSNSLEEAFINSMNCFPNLGSFVDFTKYFYHRFTKQFNKIIELAANYMYTHVIDLRKLAIRDSWNPLYDDFYFKIHKEDDIYHVLVNYIPRN